jgi:tetratricopeptide (TPR) repeat protein
MTFNPRLARKDAQIGDFYLESGNYKGAYDRFLEANRSDPGNAEAVFGLAESARRLQHRDEALRNYRLYLSALPNGPRAKEVRKALREMGAAPPA